MDSTYPGSPENCATPTDCNQIILQTAQITEEVAPATWQPGLPLKIVGTGFGYQPTIGLPYAGQGAAPPNLYIADCPSIEPHCSTTGPFSWNTTGNAGSCQVYIANWTDSSISLVLSLQVGLQDLYEVSQGGTLSPLSDVTWLAFQAANGASPQCPVGSGDTLYFTITNPQSTASSAGFSVKVSASGTLI